MIKINVKDVMKKGLIKIDSDKTIYEATKLMSDNKISLLVVRDEGKDAGIISGGDILKLIADKKDFNSVVCKDVMITPVISIDSNATLKEANDLMGEKKVRRLIVTEDNEFIGIVSVRDVADKFQVVIASKLSKDYPHTDY